MLEPLYLTEQPVSCPACRARQHWADACTRCGADLRECWAIAVRRDHLVHQAAQCLADGRLSEAEALAEQACALEPSELPRQLRACCAAARQLDAL